MKEKVPYIIYQFWTGDTPMSQNRKKIQKDSINNFGVPVRFMMKTDIEKSILNEYPIHPAYKYLADIHKSDYLRSYFLYHFGGGYADIKKYSKNNNWKSMFDLINSDEKLDCIGTRELKNGSPIKEYNKPENLSKLLSNGYFIVRPHSIFSELWYWRVQHELDIMYDKLKLKPGRSVHNTLKNDPSYALRWAQIQGEIFHKLNFQLFESGSISNKLNTGRVWEPYR